MHRGEYERVFDKLAPDEALKEKVLKRLEEKEMKKFTRKSIRNIAAVAACVVIVGVSSVLAAGNIISYFQSDSAIDLTDIESLKKYNDAVGVSSSNFGYTLTLDNIAVDDNFMHVFYTLKSEQGRMTLDEGYDFWFQCRVNGERAGSGNHNKEEGYIADDGSFKGVLKKNIASMELPDTFQLEFYADGISKQDSKFEAGYLTQDYLTLTDDDISQLLYVSTTAKKSAVKAKTVVKNLNKKITVDYYDDKNNLKTGETEISKVVFSPFGNQLVVTDTCTGAGGLSLSGWALFDENGQSLDILNTDFYGAAEGQKVTNVLEFLKAGVNTKTLKFVPLKDRAVSEAAMKMEKQMVGTYPMVFKTNDYGSIVVTDIHIKDGEINIDYYKDGFSLYDAEFDLLDKDGNDVNLGGKFGCTRYTRVHHDTNSYTAQYKFNGHDENGNEIKTLPKEMSKESLENALHFINILGEYNNFELDYDNAFEINLK